MNETILSMFGDLFGSPVWVVVQTSLLVASAGCATMLMRRVPAAGRHAVWAVALTSVLMLPALARISPVRIQPPALGSLLTSVEATPSVPPATVKVSRASEESERSALSVPVETAPAIESEAGVVAAPSRTRSGETPPASVVEGPLLSAASVSGAQLALLAWGLVASVLLLRFVAGAAYLNRLSRGTTAPERVARIGRRAVAESAVDRRVRFVMNRRVRTPMTWGVVRPVVLLPETASEWGEERLRIVLAHELAHVARMDVLLRAIGIVARAVYWFNPLVWWASLRLSAEAERACDDVVLRNGARPSAYADHLLAMATSAGRGGFAGVFATPMAQKAGFEGRLLSILGSRPRGRLGIHALGPIVAVGFLVSGVVASVSPGPAEALQLKDLPSAVVESSVETPSLGSPTRPAAKPTDVREPVERDERDGITDRVAVPAAEAGAVEVAVQTQEVTALDRMIRALDDEDAGVRASIARALGEQEDPRAIAALIRALTNDTDEGVRESAAWALGQYETPDAVPALVGSLGDESAAVRRTAVWALGQIESAEAVDGLGRAMDDPDERVRSGAIWAMGQIEDRSAVPFLRSALSDADAEVRSMAVWALGQIDDEAAVPALIQAVADADSDVRNQAVWALGQIEDPSAVPILVSALSDDDAGLRTNAAWALGQIESAEALPGLARALSDSDAGVRASAAWAIGQIEPSTAPEALVDAVSDPEEHVSETAIWALGQIEDPGTVAALRGLLDSDAPRTRRGALYALGQIRTEAAVEAMAAFLEDPDPEVRRAAAAALAGRHMGWGPRPRPRPNPRPRPWPRPMGGHS